MQKPNVILITHTPDPLQVIAAACRLCYSPKDIQAVLDMVWDVEGESDNIVTDNERLIKEIVASGHTSVIEHASITFGIEGISRACTHQLVRKRIASYSQQSQRYVKFSPGEPLPNISPDFLETANAARCYGIFDKALSECAKAYNDLIGLGAAPENARFVLPNATETKIITTMNFRALLDFFHERCCNRAQWEIRAVATKMLIHAINVCPAVFENAGPECHITGKCKQGKRSCGRPWHACDNI